MAGREDQGEDNTLYDNLNRLRYEVGRLQLHMRNNNDCVMSELYAPSTVVESKVAETLHQHSENNPGSLEQDCFHQSLSDRILTDVINQCKDPVEQTYLCSEYLRKLNEIEAGMVKKVDELRHRYEESFSQIIHSIQL